MGERIIETFEEFWPFYLSQHAHPKCRQLHFVGTTLVVSLFGVAFLTGNWWLAALIPVAGYGFAWYGHFVIEKNRPATFAYPLWSLAADFLMWAKTITGELAADLNRFGVTWPPAVARPHGA